MTLNNTNHRSAQIYPARSQRARRPLRFIKSLIACVYTLLLLATANAGDLHIGVSQRIITPEIGTPMAGYYFDRGAEGVHDDLYTKAMVLEKDGRKVVLISCDLIEIPNYLVDEIRAEIHNQTGIPAAHVMLSATHAHTGPVIPEFPIGVQSAHELVKSYAQALPEKIAKNVKQANAALQPASLQYGLGQETTLSFNRRFLMKDGSVRFNPGKSNPDKIRPVGPIDPDVPVLYAETTPGLPLAIFVSFAMHLDTVGGLAFSADYPYTLAKILSAVKSPDLMTLFTMGCSGNVNHLNFFDAKRQKGHDEAARIGTVLGGEVLKTLMRLEPVDADEIKIARRVIDLPLVDVEPSERQAAEKIIATYGTENPAPFMDMVNAFKIKDVLERNGKPLRGEVQVVTLGNDVAIVGLNGEIFVELGLAIKASSPYPLTIVSSLTNGTVGYVPDRKAYAEGHYEPVSARCAAGSGEMLVETAVDLLHDLFR